MNTLKQSSDVDDAYYYEEFYANTGYNSFDDNQEKNPGGPSAPRDINGDGSSYYYDIGGEVKSSNRHREVNRSHVDDEFLDSTLSKRAGTPALQKSDFFELSLVSVAPGQVWGTDKSKSNSATTLFGSITGYNFLYDASAGSGQSTYIVSEQYLWETHQVSVM